MKFLEKTVVRVSLTLLVFSLTFVVALWLAKIDLKVLGERFLSANFAIASLSIPLVYFSHWLRAWRWKTLLSPVRSGLSIFNMFSSVMLGYAANNIIPRSGEILRPYAYSRREKLPLSLTIASVIVERFIDILNLLLFMSIALVFVGDTLQRVLPNYNLRDITRSFGISAVGLLVLLVLVAATPMAEVGIRVIIKPFSEGLWKKLHDALTTFKHGLQILKRPSEYPLLALQSCLIWLFYILPVYVMFLAFDTPSIHNLSFVDACIVLLVTAIATTITPPLPGAFILIPTFLAGTLIPLYGVMKEDAAAYSLLTFMLNYIPVTILGGLFMLREQVRPTQHVDTKIEEIPSSEQTPI